MSGEVDVTAGYEFDEDAGEVLDLAKLNRLVRDLIARVQAGAIGAREIADGSITADKLDSQFEQQIALPDGSVTAAKLASAAVIAAKIDDDAVTAAKINADVAGDGLGQNAVSGALEVKVDDATIGIATDTLAVKDGGVTLAKLASAARPNVVQAVVTTTPIVVSALASWTDIAGMSVAITPSSTASKVLVTVCVAVYVEYLAALVEGALRLVRGSTTIAVNAGGTIPASCYCGGGASDNNRYTIQFLDSPASAAATTYKLQGYLFSAGTPTTNKMYLNMASGGVTQISTITAQEVHAV
jgi:hypothetical protein